MSLKLLLAKSYNPEKNNPAGWWMSEKLDGVRAYWDGEKFLSRNGNEFFAPEFFRRGMPKCPLDGELYMGRGKFQDTVSIVRQHDAGMDWEKVRYHVFDCLEREDDPFGMRIAKAGQRIVGAKYAVLHPHVICQDSGHLMELANQVWDWGGEGVMIREPHAPYEHKRSGNLLKVKNVLDGIAEVVGYEEGQGKHSGRLGALICSFGGIPFNVGTGFSDTQREWINVPKKGTTIRFAYTELTQAGVPRHPRFLCVDKGD